MFGVVRYCVDMPVPTAPAPSLTPAPINLDATDHDIIRELERDARIAWAELGRRVSLTAPAVRERVRRMERAGVITGYGAWIDPARVGRPIGAFVRICAPTQPRLERLLEYVQERGEIVECHSLTGEDSVLVRVQVSGMVELDRITTSLAHFGRTTTSLVLASPIPWRNVVTR
ncbi:MAG: Lrp/AsnC family transcriptional regulator [Thermoleophilia bacterium]|nr:Lrp/AsnC family transcriptional regulator [Thermoleophilia bacterium]